MTEPTDKVCQKCGLLQPLERFSFRKDQQRYRTTCKACRAAEHRARRSHPDNVERLREMERQRSQRRRPAIRAWERAHPDNLRPGQRRRRARRMAKLREMRRAAQASTDAAAAPPVSAPSLPQGVGGQNPQGSPFLDRSLAPQTHACVIQPKKFALSKWVGRPRKS